MAKELNHVEIFATGTWHPSSGKVTITEEDLDDMVQSFTELGSIPGFTPVLKLGHADAQKWFGQKGGSPALGFVSKIWREGRKILANFSNVPDSIVDLISKRRYNSVSVEIFPRYEHEGRTLKNVLFAVALLGAELPAVKGLKELASSLFNASTAFSSADVVVFEKGEPVMTAVQFSQEQHETLLEAAIAKAVEITKGEFAQKVSDLETSVTKLTGERDRAVEALREFTANADKREFETMVETAMKDGKLTPAQKPMALAFADSLKGMVKFGDGEKPAKVLFKEFLDGFKAGPDTSEKGSATKKSEFASAAEEVVAKANKLVGEKQATSFAAAVESVLVGDPALKARYVAGE
jgi:hypothetical protein